MRTTVCNRNQISALTKLCCANFIVPAILSTFVLAQENSVSAQVISTSSISLPTENQERSKKLAALEIRARRGEVPYRSFDDNIKPSAGKVYRLPALTEKEIRGEPNQSPELEFKPLRIGTVRSLSPVLNLMNATDTYMVWQGTVSVASIASAGSLMTRLHFVDFRLPQGARVFVYSATNLDDVYGPYVGKGPFEKSDFWTPPIEGEQITIEYFNPEGVQIPSAPFLINELSHLFKDPLQLKVGSCHNDIPSAWVSLAKAVGGIDYIAGPDELWCTGTLLSNQSNDYTPFFLTAEHCGVNNSNAQTVRVWWFYDAAGQTLASKPHSDISRWLASRDKVAGTDFTLLQILGSLPSGMTWSGWTTSMPSLFTAVVGIHHPDKSYKRISFGDIGTSLGCPSTITCSNFLPVDWDNIGGGGTEPGSSGSGLWRDNSSNPQLVGQLWGGGSSCDNLFNNDYYGRFDYTYNQISTYMNGTWAGSDDNLEQNDSRSAPYSVAANSSYGNLVVKYSDEDWYRISVPSDATISFTTNFEHDYGDVDMALYRGSDSTPVDTSESATDSETVQHVNTGSTSDYFVRVFLFRGATYSSTRNTYNMNVSIQQTTTGYSIGQGAPNPQIFIDAANRNSLSQYVVLPTDNPVHSWNCSTCDPNNSSWGKGLIQDFNGLDGVTHDALMRADTNTNFVALIYGGFWTKFIALGGVNFDSPNNRMLGYPIADRNCSDFNATCFAESQLTSPFGTSYHYQRFQGGALVLHKSGSRINQTYEVHGPIRARWQVLGGPSSGSYGLPIIDEYAWQGKRRSDFEGGSICYNPTTNQTEDGCVSSCNSPGAFTLSSPTNGQSLSSTTSVTLTWGSSANANSYDVYFGTSSNPPFVANQPGTSRTVTVSPGQTYFWKVVAKVNCGSATATAGVWSFSVQQTCTSPGAFSLTSPSNGQSLPSTTSVNLTWGSSANANSYDVYFGTSSNPPFVGNQPGTSRTVSVASGQYYWKVVARVNCGSATATAGVWSFLVQQQSGCQSTAIGVGQTLNGSLSTSDCVYPGTSKYYDLYSFSGEAGQQISASMDSSAFDTYLYLTNSANQVLAEDNNSGTGTNSRIPGSGFLTLPSNGIYFLWATSAANNLTGTYSISLSQCTFAISSTQNTVGPGTGATNFFMDTSFGCSWSAVSDSPSWLTTSSNGSGDGTIRYDYTANNSTSPRTGRITVAGLVHTVTQIGLGGAGSVQFSAANYSVNEGAGQLTITVTRIGSGDGTVQYSTSNGTATAGADYTSASGILFFSGNETSESFNVPILDDSAFEGNETINLSLSSKSPSLTFGSPTTAIVTIIDDDTVPAPTANAASGVTSDGFIANWSSSGAVGGYRLDVSTSSSFASFVSGYQNLDVGNALSRTITGLTASTLYYYRVRAYSGGGTSANSNIATVSTLGPMIFIEQGTTNRAAALDSVTWLRDPFRVIDLFNFSADRHTRVIIFTSDLGLTQPDSSVLIVRAGGFTLTVEEVDAVVGVSGMNASYIIVRLPDGLPAGDLPLTVTLRGLASVNSPTLSISP